MGGTCRPLSGPCLHNNPCLSPVILGVDSQTVIQEPAMSVSLGGTVTLTCAFSSGSVTSSNYPGWFQQTPGQPPRTVIYSTNSRPTGVPSRFSGAISGNKATLTITGAQAEDEADYYCQSSDDSYTPHSDTGGGGRGTQTPPQLGHLPLQHQEACGQSKNRCLLGSTDLSSPIFPSPSPQAGSAQGVQEGI